MIKLVTSIAAIGSLFLSSSVSAIYVPTASGVAVVTINSVREDIPNKVHIVTFKDKSGGELEVALANCPSPVVNDAYYVLSVPNVAMFMTTKTGLDSEVTIAKGKLSSAMLARMKAKMMCLVLGARLAVSI